jgi:hypothetical protein
VARLVPVPQVATRRDAVGVGEHGAGVAVLDHIVGRLRPIRVAAEPILLAESVEAILPARDDLVHVCLMPGVPQDDVLG